MTSDMSAPAGAPGSGELRDPPPVGLAAEEPVAQLPWILGAIGAVAGLGCHLLLDTPGESTSSGVGLAAFCFFGALALGFTLDRRAPVRAAIFSGLVGLVLGGLAFHLKRSGDHIADVEYGFAAGVLGCVLALPLFQADFLRRRFATPYERVHFHVWTNAIATAGAGGFTLLSFGMLWLVDGLLGLVGIEIINELIQNGWLIPLWLGGSFGAALGVLRSHLKVVGGLQAVALLVLALLAVPLALALLVFLAALILSGGAALWRATDSATPVLLICAAGCWVLANAVIRDDDAAKSPNRVMQAAALVLALGVLPLALFAAVSMGLRIDQHGLAPERLWALVAIAIAVAFGLAYWVAVARGRVAGWAEQLRAANLRLAAGVCVLALLLAIPLLDFGAISASSQLARLAAGKVSAQEFDYSALRWDFGDAGRSALARLAKHGGEAGKLAAASLALEERVYPDFQPGERTRAMQQLRIQGSDDPRLRRLLTEYVATNAWSCPEPGCTAIVLEPATPSPSKVEPVTSAVHVVLVASGNVTHLRVSADDAVNELSLPDGIFRAADVSEPPSSPPPSDAPASQRAHAAIELRPFTGRQVFIDGQPAGQPFK